MLDAMGAKALGVMSIHQWGSVDPGLKAAIVGPTVSVVVVVVFILRFAL